MVYFSLCLLIYLFLFILNIWNVLSCLFDFVDDDVDMLLVFFILEL